MADNNNSTRRKASSTTIDTSYGHLQPQALDVERLVLGALMIDKDAFSVVSEFLKPQTFYEPRNQKIYQAIQTLNVDEHPVDISTVIEELKREAKEELTQEVFAEGEQSGEQLKIVNQIIKKVKKSKTLETIASELEEEEADIKPIYEAVVSSAPDYDINVIKDRLDNM